MVYKVSLTAQCAQQRDAIVDYIVNILFSPQAAKSFLSEFDRVVNNVKEFPEAYLFVRDNILAELGFRYFLVNNYIALYLIENDQIIIHYLFHTRQDYIKLVKASL